MTTVRIDVGEVVLHGFPAAVGRYADGLAPLVVDRLSALAEGRDAGEPPARPGRVTDRAALADLVARQIWSTVQPHVGGGAPR